jgi:hypothetical protein
MEEAEYDLPEQRLLDFEPVVDITKRVCERYAFAIVVLERAYPAEQSL